MCVKKLHFLFQVTFYKKKYLKNFKICICIGVVVSFLMGKCDDHGTMGVAFDKIWFRLCYDNVEAWDRLKLSN